MIRLRSLIVATCTGCIGFILLALILQLYSSVDRGGINRLGNPAPAIEVIALAESPIPTSAVSNLLAENQLSLAYQRSNYSHIVTIVDPGGHFSLVTDILESHGVSGGDASWIGVSESVSKDPQVVARALLGDSAVQVLSVTGDLNLLNSPVDVILSPDIQPLTEGHYIFVGDYFSTAGNIDEFMGLLPFFGLEVVHMTSWPGEFSFIEALSSAATSLFGMVIFVLIVSALFALILALFALAREHRPQLVAMAICGANRQILMRSIFLLLLRPIAAGLAAFLVLSLILSLYLDAMSSTPLLAQVMLCLGAGLGGGLVCLLSTSVISRRLVKGLSRELPI